VKSTALKEDSSIRIEQRIEEPRHGANRLFLLRQGFRKFGIFDHVAHGSVE
jgi:hypothetical protein